jgi:hypothetical protein
MSAKHTPGPWKIVRYTNYEGFSIQSETDPVYGCIAERWEDTGRDKAREAVRLANARLIAAAPELLEALTEMLAAQWDGDPRRIASCPSCQKARAAIAKATREEQA